MSMVGIEAMNVFAGTASLDVVKLARHRGLDMSRFENLLMKEKSVALPYEDPITFAVVPAVLMAAALLASYLPARQASTIDPIGALRAE